MERENVRPNLFVKVVVAIILICLAACSSDQKVSGGTEDHGIVALVDKDIAGVSQKGPFVKGSSVMLYSLNEDFAQMGTSFTGKIFSDMGEFSFQKLKVPSQYASLMATGYYRNEITGKSSSGTLSLYAVSDLSNRDFVNVNLLTHLEYERVFSLLNEGLSFDKAKEAAKNDVLASFNMTGDFNGSEEMNILESGESNGMLLALSVLLQRDLDVPDLTGELQEISSAIANDGEWTNDSMKAAIADWAESADLSKIRENILSWNLGETVPEFEKYVNHYWWNVYGLPDCAVENEGDTAIAANEFSMNDGRMYACENQNWKRLPTPQLNVSRINSYDCSQALFCGNDMTRERRDRVNTSAYGDENEDYGLWYMYSDGGTSTVYFPEGRDSWDGFAYPSVEKHGAIVGTIILGVGSNFFYAGIAFPIVGFAQKGVNGANISDWAGICIIYEADVPFSILMKPANGKILTEDNYPRVQLPATTGKSVANIPWLYFAQLEGWGLPIATSAVTQIATDFLFQLDGKAGDELNFKIYAFGKKDTCGEQ